MLVLNNYLDSEVFLAIRSVIETADFPWEKSEILKNSAAYLDPAYNLQNIHGFFLKNKRLQYRSEKFDLIRPLIDRLRPLELIKVKINRTARQERHVEYGLHVDTRRAGATTAIFYINDNNGYTIFEDDEKVASVANRLVLFDSARRHTGASCTDADYRYVLNVNMIMAKSAAPG